jgi:hypothetical protein
LEPTYCPHPRDQRLGLTLNVPLKTEEDIEAAVKFYNAAIQCTGWNSTPEHKRTLKTYDCPIIIK